MKKVLFLTNYPAPYRVQFYDQLGKTMDVTVLFSDPVKDIHHRSAAWFVSGEGNFRAVELKTTAKIGGEYLCREVLSWLKKPFDRYVICGYSSPTMMLAMAYLRLHKIPFVMEIDGGLIREEGKGKYRMKKALVTMADRWFCTGRYPARFLAHYGADPQRISVYPFSSLWQRDLLTAQPSREEKRTLRRELGLSEQPMVLSIGQFIHRKGYDVLLRAVAQTGSHAAYYIIGGEETEEYRALKKELGVENVHFLNFMKKDQLVRYYRAADLFVLPTREDIWGLVINEAMAFALPVITTDRCVAGLELVEDGVNGYLVPTDDPAALAQKLDAALQGDLAAMGRASLAKIQPYTLENMAAVHESLLENGRETCTFYTP